MPAEQAPERIEFGPGVYGIDYLPEKEGQYDGEVYSQEAGEGGPSCFYDEGEKVYTASSGEVDGKYIEAEYVVYELDLRDTEISATQLKDAAALRELIESKKDEIVVKRLEIGKPHHIPRRVLHQVKGKGILRIEVPSGYEDEKMVEDNEVLLADFVEQKT